MSSNDKTSKKLVDSMRKTKVNVKKNTTNAEHEANINQQSDKSGGKKLAKSTESKKSAKNSLSAADTYQCGRRVWPD